MIPAAPVLFLVAEVIRVVARKLQQRPAIGKGGKISRTKFNRGVNMIPIPAIAAVIAAAAMREVIKKLQARARHWERRIRFPET